MTSQEALNNVNLALLRVERAIANAQRALDDLNASVAQSPEQQIFEKRIATQCQCERCIKKRLETLGR